MDIKVHNIGGYMVKNYLLETPDGIIAIDTGYPGGADKFIRRFTKRWPLSALKTIFLTHHHDDHAGFLQDLLDKTSAKVVLHPAAAAPLAAGRNEILPGAGYSSVPSSLFSVFKKEFAFPPVDLEGRAVFVETDADQYFEQMGLPLKIVCLPGHTADSIGLFLSKTGQLFCGDAAMNAVISVARHTIWIDDAETFGRSWDTMLALQPTRIYPSHGTPFSPDDLAKHRHYMDGRKLIRPRGERP